MCAYALERVGDARPGEAVVDEGVVDGHVLPGDQLHRLLGGAAAEEGADRVQLAAAVPASVQSERKRN